MEVRHHEVGIGDVHVKAERRQKHAGQAAHGEQADEAEGIQHRRLVADEPLYRVAVQLKTFTADGIATR